MKNPRGVLTALGLLTSMQGRAIGTKRVRVLSWSMASAPTLAYDEAGRLFIVYTGRVVRPSSRTERKEYRRTHWGQGGRGEVRDGGVAAAPFARVMIGEAITYTTKKGVDAELVDYVHAWGEGARGRWSPPEIVQHACSPATCPRGTRCAARGSVALLGGTYRVDDRGIVG